VEFTRIGNVQIFQGSAICIQQEYRALAAAIDGDLVSAIDHHWLVNHYRAGISAGRGYQSATFFSGIHQWLQGLKSSCPRQGGDK